MRKRFHDLAEKGRCQLPERGYGSAYGDTFGWFKLLCPATGCLLNVIAADGSETRFDHVSVSLKDRTPTWEEMAWVKSLFWDEEELVIEYHPPKSKYINVTSTVLHLWKPLDVEIPLPPAICV